MKKVLIVVDDTRASRAIFATYQKLVRQPEEVLLLHVERLEGRSLMIDMLSDSELSTLREALRGTEHKRKLDERAGKLLGYYKSELEKNGASNVKPIIRDGVPAEEILKVAREEGADLIILGCDETKGIARLISGCTVSEVEKNSKVSVLVAKADEKKKSYIGEETYVAR